MVINSCDQPPKHKPRLLDGIELLAAMSDAISVHDTNLKIIYQNPAHKKIMGECVGEYCYTAYHHKDIACEGCQLIQSFKDGLCHHRETSSVTKLGLRYFEISYSPLRDANGTIVAGIESLRDVTECKKNREELNYINECFTQALNSTQHVLYRRDVKKGCYDYISPAFETITGYPVAEFKNTSFEQISEYFHPDDRQRVFALIDEAISTCNAKKTVNFEFDYRFRKADGGYCWLHDSTTACFNDNNELDCFFGSVHDITNRKEKEENIKNSEQILRSMIDANPEPHLLIERDGTIVMANRALAQRLGMSLDEIQGHNTAEFGSPDLHKQRMSQAEEVFMSGKPRIFTESHAGLELEIHIHPVFDQGGKVSQLAVLSIDVTEKNQMQRQRVNVQKLDTFGVIARGFAHNFNNALTSIMGNISLSRNKLDESHKAYKFLTSAEIAAKSAGKLSSQLLDFINSDKRIVKQLSIAKMVEESVLQATQGAKIASRLKIPTSLLAVYGDESQICKMLNCLCKNAVEAMPGGGTLTVTGRNVTTSREKLPFLTKGEYVELSFEDQGIGISEKDKTKIFTPFFTRKAEIGAGMGLAMVHSIITNHGGAITFVSEVDKGTTFTLYLPADRRNCNRTSTKFDADGKCSS